MNRNRKIEILIAKLNEAAEEMGSTVISRQTLTEAINEYVARKNPPQFPTDEKVASDRAVDKPAAKVISLKSNVIQFPRGFRR